MSNHQINRVSKVFNISRVIAIISVVTAHTTFNIDSSVLYNLIKRFSSIGVIVFIMISGYYFNPQKYVTIKKFFRSKINTIIIPWLAIGTVIFLESKFVMGDSIEFLGWLRFIIGHNSYLYYLTILMCCYLIYFYPAKHKRIRVVCAISFLITILSQQLTAWGVLDVTKIHITNYLNIFNWIGYFSLGLWMKEIDVYKIMVKIKQNILLLILAWLILFGVSCLLDVDTGYFSLFAIPLQIFGAIVVFGMATFDVLDCGLARYMAKISFSVYLLHMAVVPVVYKFIGDIFLIKLFMPIVTLLLMAIVLFVCEKLASKLNLEKLFYRLSGIRK